MLAIFLEVEKFDSTATGSLIIFQNRSPECNSEDCERIPGTLDCQQLCGQVLGVEVSVEMRLGCEEMVNLFFLRGDGFF